VTPLKLGTRGSQLALYQARTAADLIFRKTGRSSEIVTIRTSGDRLSEAALSEVGGKRLFVKEIEEALVLGSIDLAVHSSKDLPSILPDELTIGAALERDDPRDALLVGLNRQIAINQVEDVISVLGQSPRLGTSSVRRVAQLSRLWPGANFAPIRGNLDTRLRKLDEGQFDGIVLAAAGLERLALASRISLRLPLDACVPAPGQGIIAIEIRTDRPDIAGIVSQVSDGPSADALAAERALVEALGGGCQMPLGAIAVADGADDDDLLLLKAIVISIDGDRAVRARARGRKHQPVELGRRVAAQLLAEGAGEILDEVRNRQAPVEGLQP
jgi:hydroxymethylbilane synthase